MSGSSFMNGPFISISAEYAPAWHMSPALRRLAKETFSTILREMLALVRADDVTQRRIMHTRAIGFESRDQECALKESEPGEEMAV